MPKKRITLADIARVDGSHVTTVSLALRNSQKLPQSTRERIQSLAQEMGYAPDPMLRALVSYRESMRDHPNGQVLAYVTNWTTRWGWKETTAHPDFYRGACKAAKNLGYTLEHFWMRESGLSHGRLNQILEARGIQGVVIASHSREFEDSLQLNWDQFSAVKIDFFPHQPQLHNITNDQCGIIRLAVQRARAAGYKRIGMVMHRGWDHSVDRMWSAGFLVEQELIPQCDRIPICLFPNAEPVENWINEGKGEALVDEEIFYPWLEKWQPEVIISHPAFVLPRLQQKGIRVPEDISFIDIFLEDQTGEYAGVRQNHETVGALSVEILAGRLMQNKRGVPKIPTTTFVEGTWVPGRSMPVLNEPALQAVGC
ncbi:MAG: LacI family transcriptional regulator [Puniceicoccaceae bacterium 5H]|nr:MAG: LacI family transcriptional regulator [Puniceicoccaceae bacterium 5H]